MRVGVVVKKSFFKSVIQIGIMALAMMIVFKFVVSPVRVNGHSMDSTLHEGNIGLVNSWGVKEDHIERFDIVVAYSDTLDEKVIKRVIGLPGDTVEYMHDRLYINGTYYKEDFLDMEFVEASKKENESDFFTKSFEYQLGEGEFFLMGDNRLGSTDSRELGPFTIDNIIGNKGLIIFPFSYIQWL